MENLKECGCKGCDAAQFCKVNDSKAKICPCRICIIKMICEDPCEDYEKWQHTKPPRSKRKEE